MASRPWGPCRITWDEVRVGTEPGTRDQGPAETILASLGDRRWALYRDGPTRGITLRPYFAALHCVPTSVSLLPFSAHCVLVPTRPLVDSW